MNRALDPEDGESSRYPEQGKGSRDFWSLNQPGFRFSSKRPGTPEFFSEVEQHRYALESHIPDLVRFETWRDRDVLEVGCGIGTDGLMFARAGARYTGVDRSSAALTLARRRFELEGRSARFAEASAYRLPYESETFDLVFSHGVLHHLERPREPVSELHRVLRPGGIALVMIYHRDSFNYRVNIMLLRRFLAALLVIPGTSRLVAAVTGEGRGVIDGHRTLLREHGLRYLTDSSLFLSNNTDGPGNPLSTVFSRVDAVRLFGKFASVQTAVRFLNLRIIPGGDRIAKSSFGRHLERRIGWHLYVLARKADA